MKAHVSNITSKSEKIVLRFVLVEERNFFLAPTGIRYHHNIVRDFPGGFQGFPVDLKGQDVTATVNLDKVMASQQAFFKKFADAEEKIPDIIINSKNLRIVAFVQDATNNTILQSAQVDLEDKQ